MNVILFASQINNYGYPPEDLVLSENFVDNNLKALDQIIDATKNITTIVGFIDKEKDKLFNSQL